MRIALRMYFYIRAASSVFSEAAAIAILGAATIGLVAAVCIFFNPYFS
jgi:hypothetical protein